jgi:hypothetical protein
MNKKKINKFIKKTIRISAEIFTALFVITIFLIMLKYAGVNIWKE